MEAIIKRLIENHHISESYTIGRIRPGDRDTYTNYAYPLKDKEVKDKNFKYRIDKKYILTYNNRLDAKLDCDRLSKNTNYIYKVISI